MEISKQVAFALLSGVLFAGGCAHRDEFPLRNPQTGQAVTCRSGPYRFEEGAPQLRIADQCLRACARYGFRSHTGNPYADAIAPATPDDDVRPFIPKECLP
ncbi:hypothetical protein [Nitrospirillum viridazoti]|uniref:Lipoprotein n=1 Tax=Nitrospirillum viridazoti CBAmc TaxID=1441467 RepID=A0A248JT57_9PROT|nr:hypothetical protein [Nitrospirillum amazonense]ASG21651.1 hypothetical protein Y958_13205 [Nitrospirillum amazonense CBAmc]TWB42191.1 hypothetical protein FBZ91_103206 [Nitrospirillum amazonense]